MSVCLSVYLSALSLSLSLSLSLCVCVCVCARISLQVFFLMIEWWLGAGCLIGGIFGMNLHSGLEAIVAGPKSAAVVEGLGFVGYGVQGVACSL